MKTVIKLLNSFDVVEHVPDNMPLIKWPTVPPNVQEVNLYHGEHLIVTRV